MWKSKLIENQLVTMPDFGRRTSLPTFPGGQFPEGFVPYPNMHYDIKEGGTMIKVPRPFRWLPYDPGVVNCVPLGGEDTLTLTGQMSGCWLTIFVLKADGREYIGHIGSANSPQDVSTLQAKRAWCNAVRLGQITPKQAYNPFDTSLVGACKTGEVPEFYGAIDPSGKCYTVVLAKPTNAGGDPWVRRVAKVVERPTKQDVTPDFCLGTQ